MRRRFATKIDWWVGALLVVAPLGSVLSSITFLSRGQSLPAVGSIAFIVALYVGLVYPIVYELDDDALVIRCGLMRSRIPYRDIKGVRPTRSPLSSPALSLDRLHIDAGNPLGPNISPADRAGFLTALAARTPHLALHGEVLAPPGA